MELLSAIAQRSSTRSYTGEKLTAEELDALLTAGLQAPTATNRQELHFTVLAGDDPVLFAIQEAMGARMRPEKNFWYDAPTVIVISGERDFRWTAVDAGIAVENIALAAEALGLGNVILGCLKAAMDGENRERYAKTLRFPEGYAFQIAIAVGRKAAGKEPHTYDREKQVTIAGLEGLRAFQCQ